MAVPAVPCRRPWRAVNIKLCHNAPSGTKRRKPKDCHLSVFVHNCHTSARIPFMAGRIHEEGVEPLSSYGTGPELRSKVNLLPIANGGCIMTQHKTSCLAAVLVSLCITFVPGGTNGCTGERYRECERLDCYPIKIIV